MSVLSPEKVLHLKDLGVEFKGTSLVWAEGNGHPLWDDTGECYYVGDGDFNLYTNEQIGDTDFDCIMKETTIPAPNFQEILKLLPNYIEASFSKKAYGDRGQNVKCGLTMELGAEGWSIDYTCELIDNYADIVRESATERSFTNENILTAAYDLLCWCAENKHLNNIQQ